MKRATIERIILYTLVFAMAITAYHYYLKNKNPIDTTGGYTYVMPYVNGDRLFAMVNEYRSTKGLPPFTKNDKLCQSARAKSLDMSTKKYFMHDSPNGTKPWDFIAATGYNYLRAGENLAASNLGEQSIVTGWINSEGHRKNMEESFTESCIQSAYAHDLPYNGKTHDKVFVVTQHFATPPR